MKKLLALITLALSIANAEDKVELSKSFIEEINSGATTNGEFWRKHQVGYAELSYFVLIGDTGAIEAISRIIVDNWANRRRYDDHMEIHYLAKILSLNEMSGFLLNKANPDLCEEVSEYYMEFKEDFVGIYDQPWTANWCE